MITTEVMLANGEEAQVKRLGLFELDQEVSKGSLGKPYTVQVAFANGEHYEYPFDMSQERPKPSLPLEQCQEGTPEYFAGLEWLRYQEGLQHPIQQYEAFADYCKQVSEYILANCLPAEIDVKSLVAEDMATILAAALCPQVTMADIVQAIEVLFEAEFDGQTVLAAYQAEIEPGLGSYQTIKVWESQLQRELGRTEEEYSLLPVKERARLIASEQLPKMVEALGQQRMLEEMKQKSAKK